MLSTISLCYLLSISLCYLLSAYVIYYQLMSIYYLSAYVIMHIRNIPSSNNFMFSIKIIKGDPHINVSNNVMVL